ncbi:hypothetical protein APB27_31550 [Pseudomonas aeruginosa]|uniref:DUF6088 family protein n=1 Tax=Pseudomonas aeruginosa group TaxID=136841 RepID=UPI0008FB0FF5|nr:MULTISPECIES: DUF6088 family protein [Pseudomonas aeruginosa group]MCW8021439.1 DUF6088 family protein [Pseudomonas aeruginosa]OPE31863.1 hypothetical protein APB27_31550 [Pseudomonas aeruginosa]RTT31564.1 hypothetical protein DY956_23625 [Pseudomonas paraeruginosa]
MRVLEEKILEHRRLAPEGWIITAKDFLHAGSRSAVSRALVRLEKTGRLIRVSRGLYVAPVTGRLGPRAPATQKVVYALAERTHKLIVCSGALAACHLGLTQQVPVREVFLTCGRARSLQLGKLTIIIQRAPRWQLALGNTIAGDAVRAMAWLGEPHAYEAAEKLYKLLPKCEWMALEVAKHYLPVWMAEAIRRCSDVHGFKSSRN